MNEVAQQAEQKEVEASQATLPTQAPRFPSIGRIVGFTPATNNPTGKEYAAIVTHVFSDTCVNLNVLSDGSFPLPESERLVTSKVQSDDGQARPDRWRWLPRVC